MGVIVRKNSRSGWDVKTCIHGRRKSKHFGTKSGALSYQEHLEQRLGRQEDIFADERAVPLFSDFAREWLQEKSRTVRVGTTQRYREVLENHLIPRFGRQPLDCITHADLVRFTKELNDALVRQIVWQKREKRREERIRDRFLSRATILNILKPLPSIFLEAMEQGILDQNPATRLTRHVKKGTDSIAKSFNPLTDEQLNALEKKIRDEVPKFYVIFLLAVRCGMRRGEILALQWQDVEFGSGSTDPSKGFSVRQSVRRGVVDLPKTRMARRVQMDEDVWRALKLWRTRWLELKLQRQWPDSCSWVFPNEEGRCMDPNGLPRKEFDRCLGELGLPHLRFHDLRHQFASRSLHRGLPVAFVARQLGHSTPKVTLAVYTHFVDDRGANLLDSIRPQAAPAEERENCEAE